MTTPVCFELVISAREEEKDFLSGFLFDIGETSFVEGAVDCDIEFDYDALRETDYYSELASGSPIILYSEDRGRLEEVSRLVSQAWVERFGREIPLVLRPIADQNWRESWKASFRPVDVQGVFVILPPWERPESFSQPHKLLIDPGMAFGTGQHETTRLCLEMLLEVPCIDRVFDVGTGSGILAIAARKLGAMSVLGCDVDPDSVAIARENAAKNGVAELTFTVEPISEIADRNYSLVFANIQNKPLRGIMGEIVKRTALGGDILISGILVSEGDEFCEFLRQSGLEVLARRSLGSWEGFRCRRPVG